MSNAVAKRTDQKVSAFLEAHGAKLQSALPQHCSIERIARVAVQEISGNAKLQACTAPSLVRSIITASTLGLEIGSTLGQAYLVPYKTTCTFIPGYKGLISLAINAGNVSKIYAEIVCENDEIYVQYGTDKKIDHKPKVFGDRGKMIGAYAVYVLKDGTFDFEIMTAEEINVIRDRSPGGKSGPWKTDYNEMARKTVIRRLSKRIPMSAEKTIAERQFHAAVQIDNAAAVGEQADVSDTIDVTAVAIVEEIEAAEKSSTSAAPSLPPQTQQ